MNRLGTITGITLLGASVLSATGADDNRGQPGSTDTGQIRISLEITEDITAGFLQNNPGTGDSGDEEQLTTRLIQTIVEGAERTMPLCVLSSGGGYFEVTLVQIRGRQADAVTNTGPVRISLGDGAGDSIRFQSATEDCTEQTAIPVTIQLNSQESGEEVGTIQGRFNLLVKSE